MSLEISDLFPSLETRYSYRRWPSPRIKETNSSLAIKFKAESGFIRIETRRGGIKTVIKGTKIDLETHPATVNVYVDQTLAEIAENYLDPKKILVEYEKENDENINETVNLIRCFSDLISMNGQNNDWEQRSIV